jgi:hypothetical protein
MCRVFTAETAKLGKFQATGSLLFVFGGHVIAILTLSTLQDYIISGHILIPLSLKITQ